jgi:hypothetical protein
MSRVLGYVDFITALGRLELVAVLGLNVGLREACHSEIAEV